MPDNRDPSMTKFEASFLRSAEQVAKGQVGRVHTPQEIFARRVAPGDSDRADEAQAGSDQVPLDPEMIKAFKAVGPEGQAKTNDILKDCLKTHPSD